MLDHEYAHCANTVEFQGFGREQAISSVYLLLGRPFQLKIPLTDDFKLLVTAPITRKAGKVKAQLMECKLAEDSEEEYEYIRYSDIFEVVITPSLAEESQIEVTDPRLELIYTEMLEAYQSMPTRIDAKVQEWLDEHPEATTTVEDGSITRIKFTNSLNNGLPSFYDTTINMIADEDLKAGMTAVTHGYNSVNDGKGSIYRISGTKPLTVSVELNNGLYAEEISKPLNGEMVMNDDSSKQWLADCALNWMNHASECAYEGDKNLFFDDTQKIEGKWSLTCSIFAMAVIFGIDFDHSKYNGLAANDPNPNAYKDDILLEYLRNPEGFYSDDILPYLMTKGYVFKPTKKLSNVQTGDILFYANGNATPETNFMGIDHSAVFAYHNNDQIYSVWEVGNDQGAVQQTYRYSYAEEHCLFVARVPFKQHETVPTENLFAETTSASTTQIQQIQCALKETVKANTWYTFICKATNVSRDAVFPALYAQGFSRRLTSYNSAYVARPYNDVYIMPFYISSDESDYLYPSFVARSDGTTGSTLGDFEWVCLVKGFYSDLDEFLAYFVDVEQQLTNIRDNLYGIDNFSDKITTTHTKASTFAALKNNKVCNITITLTLTSAVSAYGVLATIPSGYRPVAQQILGNVDITASGNIRSRTAMASGSTVEVSCCYITA